MKRKVCCFLEKIELGGIESFLTEVLLHCDLKDLQIEIVAAKIWENPYTDILKSIGVKFTELSGRLRSPKNFSLFKNLLSENKYDVIHFNIFHGLAFKYVRIAESAGVPVRIVHAHGAGLRQSKTRFLKLILHRICRFIYSKAPTHRLACSNTAARFLFGKAPATVIRNGIRTENFRFSSEARSEMRDRLGLDEETLLCHIGRMSEEKNQWFAIDVFNEYRKIDPNSHLALAGDGPMRELYEKYAEDLGIKESVTFLGNVKNTNELLSAADFFIFPSIVEGLGIAAVEAQASGLYALCSDSLPPEAKITDRFLSLPITEPEVWAQELEKLSPPTERERYADTVRACGFDISDTAAEIGRLYTEGRL